MDHGITISLFAIGLFLGMLVLLEVGRRIGARRLAQDPEGAEARVGTVGGLSSNGKASAPISFDQALIVLRDLNRYVERACFMCRNDRIKEERVLVVQGFKTQNPLHPCDDIPHLFRGVRELRRDG